MAKKTTTKYTQTVTETFTNSNPNHVETFGQPGFTFPHEELNAYNPAKPASYLVQIPTDIHSSTVAVDNKITIKQFNDIDFRFAERDLISMANINYQDSNHDGKRTDYLDSGFFALRAMAGYSAMFDAVNAYERNTIIQNVNSPFGMHSGPWSPFSRPGSVDLSKNCTAFATPMLMKPQAGATPGVEVITNPFECPKICHDVRITLPKDFTVETGYTLEFVAKVLAHAHLNDFLVCSSDGSRRVMKIIVMPQPTNYRPVREYDCKNNFVDYLEAYIIYDRKRMPDTNSKSSNDFFQIDLAWGGSFVVAYNYPDDDSGAMYVIKEKVMVSYNNSLQAVTVSLNTTDK